MICPECLTWPVTAENELCFKCQREIDALTPQPSVTLDPGKPTSHFPDIEQMRQDLTNA
jgi:hypothetical protein